jgi:hypothetical protein
LSHIYKAKAFQFIFPPLTGSSLHIIVNEFLNKLGTAEKRTKRTSE